MENASKALIMAAEVLVGVLVISLMVYLFATFGADSAEINKELDESKLAQFNAQFDKFNGSNEVTIYDIVSIANLARENNKYYELDNISNSDKNNQANYYIIVTFKNVSIEGKTSEDLTDDYIKKEKLNVSNELPYYYCEVDYSNATGRVKKVSFN